MDLAFLDNYKKVLLATFKYLSLLRSAPFPFPQYLHSERVMLDDIRFRFKEKTRPEDYATSLSQRLPLPPPPELVLTAQQLTYPWQDYADPEAGERKVREYLEAFRVQGGRAVLMAKPEEFQKLDELEAKDGQKEKAQWDAEPWYGTLYRVERFDETFMKEVRR
jgi:insulysin